MKKLLLVPFILAGCSSTPTHQPMYVNANPPPVQLVLDSKVQQMSRNEVIQATQDCEGNGMRASVIMTKRLISGMMSDIIVDVQCLPKMRLAY